MSAFVYGKMSQHAVSAVSYLAEHYGTSNLLSSGQIAEARCLPQPVVAKILTTLSAAGLVAGTPGPSGGYRLGRDPGEITFFNVVCHFEILGGAIPCPLGPDWCGTGPRCPVHDEIADLRESGDRLLQETNFAGFVGTDFTKTPGDEESTAESPD